MLLRNLGLDENGVPEFASVGMALGADDIRDARGVAVADFDNDGDLDLVVNNNPAIKESIAPLLLRNEVGQQRNWLAVDLEGTASARSAVGASVTLELANGKQLTRHVTIGTSYASQRSRRLHFGLGDCEQVTTLRVKWLGNPKEEVFHDVAAKQLLHITEGKGLESTALSFNSSESER